MRDKQCDSSNLLFALSTMMEHDTIKELRRKLQTAETRAEEEQRRREKAETRAKQKQRERNDEQRRREEAETIAQPARPKTFTEYLEACHKLSLAIEVVADRTLTTQDDTANPTSKLFPQHILP